MPGSFKADRSALLLRRREGRVAIDSLRPSDRLDRKFRTPSDRLRRPPQHRTRSPNLDARDHDLSFRKSYGDLSA
jgi:hypothetical protein